MLGVPLAINYIPRYKLLPAQRVSTRQFLTNSAESVAELPEFVVISRESSGVVKS